MMNVRKCNNNILREIKTMKPREVRNRRKNSSILRDKDKCEVNKIIKPCDLQREGRKSEYEIFNGKQL